ncbi:MAG: YtxH domain-containing protein [Solirubrobacterales bacterium]|nr:YtxH domain-containing protein [Solirubrobacterales bacterium]
MTNRTKAKVAGKTVKGLAKYPVARKAARPAVKLAFRAGKPVAKRKARQRVAPITDAAQRVGEAAGLAYAMIATYGPDAARQLGLIEPPPKPKRTAPRVVAGAVIGGTAVYFLDPDSGEQRRKKVADLVS